MALERKLEDVSVSVQPAPVSEWKALVNVPEVQESKDTGLLDDTLFAIQQTIANPTKNKKNAHHGNTYADLEAVLAVVVPCLNERGILLSQFPGKNELWTRLRHKSGQWRVFATPILATKPGPQPYGAGVTYARRYAICAALGLTQEDDDGNTDAWLRAAGQAAAEKC